MKQIEVTILGQSYVLGCPEGGEALLQASVKAVDREMTTIRAAGKVKARERIAVLAAGPLARIPAQVPLLIKGESETGTVDSHAIQPYYAGLVARAEAMSVDIALEGETVTMLAHKG